MRSFVMIAVAVLALFAITPESVKASESLDRINCSIQTSCDNCLKQKECLWCSSDDRCFYYKTKGEWFPSAEGCSLSSLRWKWCAVNVLAMVIGVSIAAFILLCVLPVACYCCCCYCPARRKQQFQHQLMSQERRDQEMKSRQEERRMEREAKREEIRAKYGLTKDGGSSYQRFDNPKN